MIIDSLLKSTCILKEQLEEDITKMIHYLMNEGLIIHTKVHDQISKAGLNIFKHRYLKPAIKKHCFDF